METPLEKNRSFSFEANTSIFKIIEEIEKIFKIIEEIEKIFHNEN